MKKGFILVALVALTMSVSAQWFDFSNNVHRYSIGINLGQAGASPQFHDFGMGISLSAWGFYADFISAGPMYKYDNRVASMNDPANLRFLDDSTSTVVNFGYQIPVLPWLRIMPLVGFYVNTWGYTDMATHNAETSGSDEYVTVSLTHDYTSVSSRTYFNFGGGLVITPVKWVNIYGVYTTKAIYGGISINLDAFFNDETLERIED